MPAKKPRSRPAAIHTLVERNYATLRRMASREIRSSRQAGTITPTSLVAESVMRLMKQRKLPSTDPHLCGLAAVLMAQALSDRSKLRRARKRGGGIRPESIGSDVHVDRRRGRGVAADADPDLRGRVMRLELLQHMAELSRTHPRMMEIVTLHVVLDMPMPKVAALLGVSVRTAYRELVSGRRKLAEALGSGSR
jgi:DNA-directed RNA polymerase specialized sigma24 family protein